MIFGSELHRVEDPGLPEAQERSRTVLGGAVDGLGERQRGNDPARTAVAAWSFVHGFATLWFEGALSDEIGDDPEAAARSIAANLFGPHVE